MSSNTLYKSVLVMVMLIVILISCNKQNTPTETDKKGDEIIQTNRIYHSQVPLISDSALAIVQGLFQKNKLSLSNLQVDTLIDDNLGNHHVRCFQFYQNLEIFTGDVTFHFNNKDIYYTLSGELITGIAIDTIPKVSMGDIGNLFYNEIANDPDKKDSLSSFLSQGFNAELGIYGLNAGNSYAPRNFVLAWKMTVANGLEYPFAYIRADYSFYLIDYDNGVRY